MEVIIVIILTILLCLALGWAVGKLPWQEWLEGITITFGCIAIGTLLTGCATPTPDYPAPGDVNTTELHNSTGAVITATVPAQVMDITGNLATPEPDGTLGIQTWVQFDQFPVNYAVQPISVAMDIDGAPLVNQTVTICVLDECLDAKTGQDGQLSLNFPNTGWPVGVIPYQACVTLPEETPVCLRASFLAVEVEP